MLNRFETPMIACLLRTDPKAAAARLENLPRPQRHETIQKVFDEAKSDQGQAIAEVIRAAYSEDEWQEAVENIGAGAKQDNVRKALEKAAAESGK